jgi:hypothetical protein
MSDLKLPGEEKQKKGTSFTRFSIWVVAAAVGMYSLLTGIVGMISNG